MNPMNQSGVPMSCHFRDLFTLRISRGTSRASLDLVIQKCQVWLSCYVMLLDDIFIPLKDMCIIDIAPQNSETISVYYFQTSPYSEVFSYHSSKFVFFVHFLLKKATHQDPLSR